MLTVRVPEADVAKAMNILNAHQAIDVLKPPEQMGLITTGSAPSLADAVPAPATIAAARMVSGAAVLVLAEEQINIGKRVIQGGAKHKFAASS